MRINNDRDNDSTITFRFRCENYVPKNNNGKIKYKECGNHVNVDIFPSDIVNAGDAAHYQKTRAKVIEKKFGQGPVLCEQCLNSKHLNQNLNNIQEGDNMETMKIGRTSVKDGHL